MKLECSFLGGGDDTFYDALNIYDRFRIDQLPHYLLRMKEMIGNEEKR